MFFSLLELKKIKNKIKNKIDETSVVLVLPFRYTSLSTSIAEFRNFNGQNGMSNIYIPNANIHLNLFILDDIPTSMQ
jgi:hypothetical protein